MTGRRQRRGEALHHKGEDGAQRAKRYLDATTRTRSSWTNKDDVPASRLTFFWPHAGQNEFSFDLGGILYGGEFDHHNFVAEAKNYSSDSDQGEHFDKFLAQCYLVYRDFSQFINQFMFITWNPFRARGWQKLCSTDSILDGCVANGNRLFGTTDADEVRSKLEMGVIEELQERLWLVVLSDKQERLLIDDEERGFLVQRRIERGLM
ncbi:hypothetical protein [Phytohabitans kaempferiae]|uniref:Uncharacterized protein n=1 Tax=Phytohabitans kaempferiae TaxID=1620943 RepID=A0ABV6MBG2_9ACTN